MFAEFLKPKCATLEYCPEHSSCGAYPKKHIVLNDHNRMKSLKPLIEKAEQLHYNSAEEMLEEILNWAHPTCH